MATIYKITNLVNGKCYIGETIKQPPTKRKAEHFRELRKGTHINKKLQNAYNKYGEDNLVFEILFECSNESRFEKEIETIKQYDSFRNGYNLTQGGEGFEPMPGDKNPMYGRSGELSPVFKGYIYQLDQQGNLINIFSSSCEAAEYFLGYKIERGTGNAKGLCGHILQACNDWSEYTRFSKDRHRFTVYGYQWIREKDYKALKQAGYDFSSKRTSKTAYPLTILGLDKGTLGSDT